jgi:hypothetical protein
MAKLFDSLKKAVGSKLKQPPNQQGPSGGDTTSTGPTEKQAEKAPPNRVGEVVGHSSGG